MPYCSKPTAFLLLGLVFFLCAMTVSADLIPTDLRCEYMRDPLGIDVPRPQLSWRLEGNERGQVQTAYQILVASSASILDADRADLWDSRKAETGQQLNIAYRGKALKPEQRVYWKVRVWDKDDQPSAYSPVSLWEMGVGPKQWQGKWIRKPGEPVPDEKLFEDHPAPLFRREFEVAEPVKNARVYISGLGYYELYINGKKVGDHVLDPAWTSYGKRVFYSVYDVTEYLQQGKNAVGVILGNGWYNPLPLRMWGKINLREHLTIGEPRFLLQMNIDYGMRKTQQVVSSPEWKTGDSPILRNSVYLGEVYDARREADGWDRPDFDDSTWENAVIAQEPLGLLRSQNLPPIRVQEALEPVAVTEPQPGVFIFDLGQNFAGWVRLKVQGEAGTVVKMRCGELLYPDGTLNAMTSCCGQIKNQDPPRTPGGPSTAYQGHTYILKGGGEETYTPRFSFHGFRYVEVTGYPGKPDTNSITGLALNSDVEPVGAFECSNELFNRIQKMTVWTQRSNMFSVQSDCPHREKFGYGGDIVASSEMAISNFDMSGFYRKAVRDLSDAVRSNGGFTETAPFVGIADAGLGDDSGPIGWGTAHPLLLWQLYSYYGERELIREQYAYLRHWMNLLESAAEDFILVNGISDHESLVDKPADVTGTGLFYWNAVLYSRLAKIVGDVPEAQRAAELADKIQAAFEAKFHDSETGKIGIGTQAAQSFALYLDIASKDKRDAVLNVLVEDILNEHEGHLTTGIFGTKFMLMALSDLGRADVAATVASQEDFPGWGHMLANGATTLWEHWEFSDNTYSHNHPMFGSISQWFYQYLAGIRPAEDAMGFDKIVIAPCPVPDLDWVRATYLSARGEIASAWKRDGDRFLLSVTIPPNCTALIRVPTSDPEGIEEGGQKAVESPGVDLVSKHSDFAVFRTGSGKYEFMSHLE